MADFKFELGSVVKDKVTGFTGVVMTRTEFVHGCARYGVQARELHEGKPVEAAGFDEPQLEAVKNAKRVLDPVTDLGDATQKPKPGGPGIPIKDRKVVCR